MICHTARRGVAFWRRTSHRRRRTYDRNTSLLFSPAGCMDHGTPHGAPDGAHVDYDAVCQKVRAAAEPARVRGVSLHDERGEVLWLTESSMGPDEHGAVRAGLDAFRKPGAPPIYLSDMG